MIERLLKEMADHASTYTVLVRSVTHGWRIEVVSNKPTGRECEVGYGDTAPELDCIATASNKVLSVAVIDCYRLWQEAVTPPPPEPEEPKRIIDLMEALRASLAEAKSKKSRVAEVPAIAEPSQPGCPKGEK